MIYTMPYMLCRYSFIDNNEGVSGTLFYDTLGGNLWDLPCKSDLRDSPAEYRERLTKQQRRNIYHHRVIRPMSLVTRSKLIGDHIYMSSYHNMHALDDEILAILEALYDDVSIDSTRGRVAVWDSPDHPVGCGWVDCHDLAMEGSMNRFMHDLLPSYMGRNRYTVSYKGKRWLITQWSKGYFRLTPNQVDDFYEICFTAISSFQHVLEISLRTVDKPESLGLLSVTRWDFLRNIGQPDDGLRIFPQYGTDFQFKTTRDSLCEINGVPQKTTRQLCETVFQLL